MLNCGYTLEITILRPWKKANQGKSLKKAGKKALSELNRLGKMLSLSFRSWFSYLPGF